jgi:hypothetical protein
MVEAVENLTKLVVRLVGVSPHPRLEGWDELEVEVVEAAPVEGLADLLSQRLGQRLTMAVRHELAADLAPGTVLTCRAKLNAGEVMAEPHPLPGAFLVQPPRPTD